jgi:hypothetical protein
MGTIFYAGVVGTFPTNRTMVLSDPLVGTPTEPEIRISSTNLGSIPSTMKILATDTCIALDQGLHQMMTPFGGIAGGTTTLKETVNLDNQQFATTGPMNTVGPLGSGSFSQTVTSQYNVLTPTFVSLSKDITIKHSAANKLTTLSAGGKLSPVGSAPAAPPTPAAHQVVFANLGQTVISGAAAVPQTAEAKPFTVSRIRQQLQNVEVRARAITFDSSASRTQSPAANDEFDVEALDLLFSDGRLDF